MATNTTKNLGFVKSIHRGNTPPTNRQMLWFDTNVNLIKAYDFAQSVWSSLSALGGGQQGSIVDAGNNGGEIVVWDSVNSKYVPYSKFTGSNDLFAFLETTPSNIEYRFGFFRSAQSLFVNSNDLDCIGFRIFNNNNSDQIRLNLYDNVGSIAMEIEALNESNPFSDSLLIDLDSSTGLNIETLGSNNNTSNSLFLRDGLVGTSKQFKVGSFDINWPLPEEGMIAYENGVLQVYGQGDGQSVDWQPLNRKTSFQEIDLSNCLVDISTSSAPWPSSLTLAGSGNTFVDEFEVGSSGFYISTKNNIEIDLSPTVGTNKIIALPYTIVKGNNLTVRIIYASSVTSGTPGFDLFGIIKLLANPASPPNAPAGGHTWQNLGNYFLNNPSNVGELLIAEENIGDISSGFGFNLGDYVEFLLNINSTGTASQKLHIVGITLIWN